MRQRHLDGLVAQGAAHLGPIGVLDRDPEQGLRALVRVRILAVGAQQGHGGLGEALAPAGQAPEGVLDELGLLRDVEPREHEGHAVPVAAEVVEAQLGVGGRRLALDPGDSHAVGPVRRQADRIEARGDVRIEIARAADLVEELGRDGADGHEAARLRVLGDDELARGLHLGQGKPDPRVGGDFLEEGVVAAAALRAAFEDMAADDARGKPVPVVALPAESPGCGAERQRRIGHAARDDHIRALRQRLGDAPPAEIRIGRHDGRAKIREGVPAVEMPQRVPRLLPALEPVEHVVARDEGDPGREALPGRDRLHRRGAAGGVEAARVGDHLDAPGEAGAQHLLHLRHEGRGIAGFGLARLGLVENGHGQLGEIVARQHVDGPALDHLARGREPVAIEPAAVGDPQHVSHPEPYARPIE